MSVSDAGSEPGRRGPSIADGSFDLMAAQVETWSGQQLDPTSTAHQIAECVEIHGPVDVSLFEAAVRQVVVEAETLRLRFRQDGGRVRQVLDPQPEWPIDVVDVSAGDDPFADALDGMRADLVRPMDLARGPLYTAALFLAGPERFLWYQRAHHLVGDGCTGFLVARRVSEVYTALVGGREGAGAGVLPPLRHLLDEDAAYHASAQFAADRDYWAQLMSDAPEPVSLAGRRLAPASSSFLRHSRDAAPETADRLRALARNSRTVLPVLIAAAAALYTARLTGVKGLMLGLWVSARINDVQRTTPGNLANVVPLRISVDQSVSLAELVRQVSSVMRGALRHRNYRVEYMRRDLGRVGAAGRLFGSSVNVMAFDEGQLRFAGHRATLHNLSNGVVRDLDFVVYALPDCWKSWPSSIRSSLRPLLRWLICSSDVSGYVHPVGRRARKASSTSMAATVSSAT